MTHIHLVYAHNPEYISTPYAIGYELTARLRQQGYTVSNYNWDEAITIKPDADAVLIGHAHPLPFTVFRKSMKQKGWKRIILLEPYAHGDIGQVAFLENIVPYCDNFLAITGNYWFQNVENSAFRHWKPRMTQLDLAVNRKIFPVIKSNFNLPSERKFVYVGNANKPKNVPYLNEIAKAVPDMEFVWIGKGKKQYTALKQLGFMSFTETSSLDLIREYDFMITVGHSDANPTTILEAMAWGLIPVCTKQSGYESYEGIINLPLNDVQGAIKILQHLQTVDIQTLEKWQKINWDLLNTHFNWDRFTQDVINAIESKETYPINSLGWQERTKLGMIEFKTHFQLPMIRQNIGFLLRTLGLRR